MGAMRILFTHDDPQPASADEANALGYNLVTFGDDGLVKFEQGGVLRPENQRNYPLELWYLHQEVKAGEPQKKHRTRTGLGGKLGHDLHPMIRDLLSRGPMRLAYLHRCVQPGLGILKFYAELKSLPWIKTWKRSRITYVELNDD